MSFNTYVHLCNPNPLCMLSHWVVSNSSATPWSAAHEAPLTMEFSQEEYWSGLPFPTSGGSSPPRNQTCISCIAGGFFTAKPPGKPEDLCWQILSRSQNISITTESSFVSIPRCYSGKPPLEAIIFSSWIGFVNTRVLKKSISASPLSLTMWRFVCAVVRISITSLLLINGISLNKYIPIPPNCLSSICG